MSAHENILITGGAGFVGSNLATLYKERFPAARVTALDNLKRRGSELNLPKLREAGVSFVHGDVRCPDDLRAFAQPFDLIVECSAEPSVLAGYGGSPGYVVQTNLVGTVNCLDLAREHKAAFVFLSTSRVYPIQKLASLKLVERPTRFEMAADQPEPGASAAGISEEFPLGGHRSLYGATKLASELLIEEYRQMYGLKTIVNRCGVIAGPRQMGKVDQGVFALWVLAHYFKRPLRYIGFGGTGKQVRDVVHVKDLFRLIDSQLRSLDDLAGGTFNVGGGPEGSLSLAEMTDICRELTGNRVAIESSAENRPGDVPIYVTDCRRVRSRVAWDSLSSPREILADIFRWVRADEAQLARLAGEIG
jgi:CDP-paratose 2-epimerase